VGVAAGLGAGAGGGAGAAAGAALAAAGGAAGAVSPASAAPRSPSDTSGCEAGTWTTTVVDAPARWRGGFVWRTRTVWAPGASALSEKGERHPFQRSPSTLHCSATARGWVVNRRLVWPRSTTIGDEAWAAAGPRAATRSRRRSRRT
jgi:hypothetical protein